ncbi:folate transporter FolT [Thermoclostridium stercorarium subsp. stercorarium DSM 8532]|jgi:ECF transporter S component (folate family)|uniref:Folate transporter FolT n=3 Tax=Thermoclostridium stercorarium TaxID=1510 RepID=L7VQX0_THES1|nr:folate family ECF transporter S component [Thermoclostridium stercorarium]AGC69192.1 folate transporter FolT [Thermoclostridium stercorarium subsp. stercorarium DSM 8532]AGI40162.1 hypothetical protein Clst_2135 [Thermoclostridium stercorarium subsp. stercorarium DSM 8532]ANW99469.1 folate transporter [Thermoclostridium stercorarium subsp. thermolacticum DSM 2910]ANX02095.1 folate transporter [Thermoclostridium stercorarium subsp. leptospartum DSM 9219]
MEKKDVFSFLKDVYSLVLVALFIAIYGVLSLLRIYIIPNQLRISFTFMPVAWAAMLFGPVAGGLTGALGDVIGWAINPVGPFFPGFTLNAFIVGFMYGMFFYKKEITLKRVIAAVVTITPVVDLVLNPVWLSIMTGEAFKVLVFTRIVKSLIMLPVKCLILYTSGVLMKKFVPSRIRRV